MVLKKIYLTRHGFRANWSGEEPQPLASGNMPPDTPLSSHGKKQAKDLANYLETIDPPIDRIISSPFVRCIQTIEPFAERLGLEILPEAGIGEWYGMHRENAHDPQPAPLVTLHEEFPLISPIYKTAVVPNERGESIQELYDRCSRVLSEIIRRLDENPSGPTTVLLCTHAATFVALCRVLSGRVPADPAETDFVPYTNCVTSFERDDTDLGRWVCKDNGNCSFLSAGKQRGWRFSGKESFSAHVPVHALDAGTGLGVIVEDI